jgi:hypothetical protein
MESVLSAGAGHRVWNFDPSQRHWPEQTDWNHACRMLEPEASKQPDRQVFWLTAQTARTAFPCNGSCELRPQWQNVHGLADHSSGPATDLHRLPFSSPCLSDERRRTCRDQPNGLYECSRRSPGLLLQPRQSDLAPTVALSLKRRHDSLVHLTAFLPSLIHCSAVPLRV